MQEQTQQSAIEAAKSRIPAQLKSLFCEDPDLYWGLLAAAIDEREPVTASDLIAVSDLVTKLWEERLEFGVSHDQKNPPLTVETRPKPVARYSRRNSRHPWSSAGAEHGESPRL